MVLGHFWVGMLGFFFGSARILGWNGEIPLVLGRGLRTILGLARAAGVLQRCSSVNFDPERSPRGAPEVSQGLSK